MPDGLDNLIPNFRDKSRSRSTLDVDPKRRSQNFSDLLTDSVQEEESDTTPSLSRSADPLIMDDIVITTTGVEDDGPSSNGPPPENHEVNNENETPVENIQEPVMVPIPNIEVSEEKISDSNNINSISIEDKLDKFGDKDLTKVLDFSSSPSPVIVNETDNSKQPTEEFRSDSGVDSVESIIREPEVLPAEPLVAVAKEVAPPAPEPEPLILPDIYVGDTVLVTPGYKMGTVKFVGETKFADGVWIGIALDGPQGKARSRARCLKYNVVIISSYQKYVNVSTVHCVSCSNWSYPPSVLFLYP